MFEVDRKDYIEMLANKRHLFSATPPNHGTMMMASSGLTSSTFSFAPKA